MKTMADCATACLQLLHPTAVMDGVIALGGSSHISIALVSHEMYLTIPLPAVNRLYRCK